MTTALEGGKRSASRPGRSLPPGKTRYSLYRRLAGPQSRSGEVRKISPPPGFDPRTIQPIARLHAFADVSVSCSLLWDIARCEIVVVHQLPPRSKLPTYTAQFPNREKGLKYSVIKTEREIYLLVKIREKNMLVAIYRYKYYGRR
jgi:hypothetical protein